MTTPSSPITVRLRGRNWPIRYSVAALEEFERIAKRPIWDAFGEKGNMPITDLVTALYVGIKHGGNGTRWDRDKVLSVFDDELDAETIDLMGTIETINEALLRSSTMKRFAKRRGEEDDDGFAPPGSDNPLASAAGEPTSSSTPTTDVD